jgi:N-acetylmuramoyl-L-alanine amidase
MGILEKEGEADMAAKVILDAGHGGSDPGAVFEGRSEKDDNLRLALAVGELLERNGIDVAYTRTEDVYDTPYEKAQIANREGGDFLISFHRNSSPEADEYSGVETLVYDRSGQKAELAENINEALEEVGFRNLGVKERPGLVLLRRSQMPAVLVETGFLNTQEDNVRFDEEFDAIARAIADGILKTLGEEPLQAQETYYRVQTGAFRRLEYAQDQLYQLQQEDFPAFILREDDYYKVQVGAFRNLDNAVRMEASLRKKGYATFITT